ncbi:hypothetical protein COTS27_01525 [Spirochaetota bacterium]|nr:hypothetical protein COTS27_01525 [Spirochaetota bacterium]
MNIDNDIFTEDNTSVTNNFNSYTAIKVKFFAQDRKIYGIFLLIYPPGGNYCEKSFLVLTTYSLEYNLLGANSSFKDFFNATYKISKEKMSFQNINFKLKNALEKDFSIIETSAKTSKLKDILEIEQELKSILRKNMSDKRITNFTFIEHIDEETYHDFFQIELHKENNPNKILPPSSSATSPATEVSIFEEINIPSRTKLISVSLILAPVEGKSIFDLNPDDRIAVIISNPTADTSEKKLEAHKKEHKKATQTARVTGNFYYEGTYHIGLEIDNHYAVVSEEANIKVKLAPSHQEKLFPKRYVQELSASNKNFKLIVITYIGVIITLILIFFYSFIWIL